MQLLCAPPTFDSHETIWALTYRCTDACEPINTPIYSNPTPHLPLADGTCIINGAECCQETSLIPIHPHGRSHTCIHQQRIATFDNRSVQAGSSNCCTSRRLQWNDSFSGDHSSLPSVSTFPFGASLTESRAAEGQRGGLWGLKTGQESMIKPAS